MSTEYANLEHCQGFWWPRSYFLEVSTQAQLLSKRVQQTWFNFHWFLLKIQAVVKLLPSSPALFYNKSFRIVVTDSFHLKKLLSRNLHKHWSNHSAYSSSDPFRKDKLHFRVEVESRLLTFSKSFQEWILYDRSILRRAVRCYRINQHFVLQMIYKPRLIHQIFRKVTQGCFPEQGGKTHKFFKPQHLFYPLPSQQWCFREPNPILRCIYESYFFQFQLAGTKDSTRKFLREPLSTRRIFLLFRRL